MTLTRENRFLITLGSIVLLASVGLMVLLMRARGAYGEISQQYDTQAAELKRLQSLEPFPDQANLNATSEQVKKYAEALSALLGQLGKQNFPMENLSPNQFQDRLREVVSGVGARAAEKGVGLPPNFYLDFDPYKDSLPKSASVPALARQLKSVELIVNLLIGTRVTSLNALVREPVPEEGLARTASATPGSTPPPAGGGAAGASPLPPLVVNQAVTANFTCEAGQLRQIANELLKSQQFLVIRSIKIQNQSPKGPAKVLEDILAAAPPAAPGAQAATGQADESRRLQFIVGKEKLDVTLRIEIVNFGPQELVARAAGLQPPAATPKP